MIIYAMSTTGKSTFINRFKDICIDLDWWLNEFCITKGIEHLDVFDQGVNFNAFLNYCKVKYKTMGHKILFSWSIDLCVMLGQCELAFFRNAKDEWYVLMERNKKLGKQHYRSKNAQAEINERDTKVMHDLLSCDFIQLRRNSYINDYTRLIMQRFRK